MTSLAEVISFSLILLDSAAQHISNVLVRSSDISRSSRSLTELSLMPKTILSLSICPFAGQSHTCLPNSIALLHNCQSVRILVGFATKIYSVGMFHSLEGENALSNNFMTPSSVHVAVSTSKVLKISRPSHPHVVQQKTDLSFIIRGCLTSCV